jgi:hypothetical protein
MFYLTPATFIPASHEQGHQNGLQYRGDKEGGTKEPLPVIKEEPPNAANNIEENNKNENGRDARLANYTELLFFATLILGMATTGLVVVAYCQMREARASIQASVNAAAAADKHIALAFRPRIVVRRVSLDKWSIGKFGLIQFIVANIGVSPGTIVESNATIFISRQGVLPAIPQYSMETNSMGHPTIHPGPGFPEKAMTLMPVTHLDYDRVFGGQSGRLYLIGYIVYDGEAGRQHMAFGREYHLGTQRFGPVADPNYEYGE